MTGILILFGFSIFVRVDQALMNTPAKTLGGFQIWRLFLPFLVCPEVISLLCTTFALYLMSLQDENRLGSARYIIGFFFKNLFLQVCVAVLGYPLNAWLHIPINSLGVWPMYVLFTTVRCMKDPETESNVYCTSIKVKNKHYPIFLLVTYLPFTIFYGLQLDLYIAFGFGILLSKHPTFEEYLEPSTYTCFNFEEKLLALKLPIGTVITERIINLYRSAGGQPEGDKYFQPQDSPGQQGQQLEKSEMITNQQSQFPGSGVAVGGGLQHTNYPPAPRVEA